MIAMTAPYSFTKILQSSQLKLLDRALTASEFCRDLAQTSLADKTPEDYLLLIGRQGVHQLVKHGPLLHVVFHSDLLQFISHHFMLLRGPLPAVGKRMRRNPQEPRHERQAAPL